MMNFSSVPNNSLVKFYNEHAERPVRRFSDRATAIKRCTELWQRLQSSSPAKVINQHPTPVEKPAQPKVLKRPSMSESLRLPRTIRCLNTGETWPNAYRMWVARPDWMSSAQQDRLTRELYRAAKVGELKVVEVNSRQFQLVNEGV
jgi:hypothetical protein